MPILEQKTHKKNHLHTDLKAEENFFQKGLASSGEFLILPASSRASVAQFVEHYLAKVTVEGSNPFTRSIFFFPSSSNPNQDFELWIPQQFCAVGMTSISGEIPELRRVHTFHMAVQKKEVGA